MNKNVMIQPYFTILRLLFVLPFLIKLRNTRDESEVCSLSLENPPSALDDFASKIDLGSDSDNDEGSTGSIDGDCENVAQRNAYSDKDVTDGDGIKNCDSSTPDATDKNHDTQKSAGSRESNIVSGCILEW